MNSDRLERLFEFLKEDPNDAFTLYAIALEYQKTNLEKAKKYFLELLENHENYIGTYYHAAALFQELGESEKASEVYQKGMAKASELGEAHALRELQTAYQNFLFEEED